MVHAGHPVAHARLLRAVWGVEYGSELEYLRTYVRQLRKKLEDNPAEPRYLLTEPSYGYRFADVIDLGEASELPAAVSAG
jgi:two-component system KDP operon response regulator KdpE